MEEIKLSKWTLKIAMGSYLAFGLVVVLGYALSNLSQEFTLSPFVLKSILIAVLYSLSIYLVATLPNKNIRRRLWSWGYSVVFHVWLLIYMYFATDLGGAVFALLIPELIITLFVILGLIRAISLRKQES